MSALSILTPGSYTDSEIKPFLDRYRQVVAQRYTPCSPSDLGRLLAAPPFYVSRKIDGELWFLISDAEGLQLVAANGRVLKGEHAMFSAGKSLPVGAILAGELHVSRTEARERVGDVRSALAASGDELVFAVFDILRFGEVTWQDSTYAARLEILQANLSTDGALRMIPVSTTEIESDVHAWYKEVVEEKQAEGIIIRCSDGRALKVKPELSIDCAVLGFTTRANSNGQDEVRSLLLGLSTGEPDTYITVGTVGNMSEGFNRKELLDILQPSVRSSQFRQAASSGQLYQMVEPLVIVECRVMDVQVEDSKGRPMKRPVLHYSTGEWRSIGTSPAGTLLNPIASRLRTDKSDLSEGSRLAQIADLLPLTGQEDSSRGSAEIKVRRVWVKETKGKKDVRKLLIWKTNNEHFDDTFPAFVVHWTDYSAGRKSPLTREVRPAATLATAEALAEGLIEANIKKGWEEVVS